MELEEQKLSKILKILVSWIHDNPNPNCPVGANIHVVLDEKLLKIQQAMEKELSLTSLAQLVTDTEARIKK